MIWAIRDKALFWSVHNWYLQQNEIFDPQIVKAKNRRLNFKIFLKSNPNCTMHVSGSSETTKNFGERVEKVFSVEGWILRRYVGFPNELYWNFIQFFLHFLFIEFILTKIFLKA